MDSNQTTKSMEAVHNFTNEVKALFEEKNVPKAKYRKVSSFFDAHKSYGINFIYHNGTKYNKLYKCNPARF